jgi:hypothetical protein
MSLRRADVGGQVDIVKAGRCDAAFDGPLQQVSVVLQLAVSGFVRRSADAFGGIDGFAAFLAVTELGCQPLNGVVELVDVVEGRYCDVSALFAFWVVAEVPHDPALNAVIVGIYRRRYCSLMRCVPGRQQDSLELRRSVCRLPSPHRVVHLVVVECADREALLLSLTAHAVQE